MKLKLKQWAQISEVIGAVAIVVSLIYVASELRRNTEATQAATFQQMVQLSATGLITMASNAELADILRRGTQDLDTLTEQEQFRFFLINRAQWRAMEAAYFQHKHGVLGGQEWGSYKTLMCGELRSIMGQRASWDAHRSVLSPDFVSFIESCVAPAP
jgi:hypothetical protein